MTGPSCGRLRILRLPIVPMWRCWIRRDIPDFEKCGSGTDTFASLTTGSPLGFDRSKGVIFDPKTACRSNRAKAGRRLRASPHAWDVPSPRIWQPGPARDANCWRVRTEVGRCLLKSADSRTKWPCDQRPLKRKTEPSVWELVKERLLWEVQPGC